VPTELTSFVGRRDEVAEVKRLLTESHLVTLTGIGGVGKTRLALRAAAGDAEIIADEVTRRVLAGLSSGVAGLYPQVA
jgi:predicted ATPase